ncbi:MAG: hypothetical protein GXN98_02945 [Euryarchaeota archaeon]|nr:hypothetical protein [Euryarchaeota archaeon]
MREGNGRCLLCGSAIAQDREPRVCEDCEKKHEIVFELDPLAGHEDLIPGKLYLGRVKRVHEIGYFIALNQGVVGLLRRRDARAEHMPGEEVVVKVTRVRGERVDLLPWESDGNYTLVPLRKPLPLWKIGRITMNELGVAVRLRGIVAKVQRTSGPTVFTVYDETGAIECTAFASGERAYPSIDRSDVVEVRGEVVFRLDRLQVEVRHMEKLYGAELSAVRAEIDRAIERKAEPAKPEPLVSTPVLEALYPRMLELAKQLRKAVLTGVPIYLRHHADADGFIAGVAIERALLPLMRSSSPDREAEWHLFKRLPSRAPFYEMEDVVRDLQYSLEDAERFGTPMPLVLVLDNGSTIEDLPAMRKLRVYGARIMVVDHHYPGELREGKAEVDEVAEIHINPYLAGGDYSLTAGCLGVELARMINPEEGERMRHLPGIACVADRVKGETAERYISLAEERGYTKERMELIAECIDYEAFHLRFMDGRGVVEDLLGLGRLDRQAELVDILWQEAKRARDVQLRAALENLRRAELRNGLVLCTIDLERYTHRFSYPPAGKTTGMVHDAVASERGGERTVTIGYGPDFAVLRATEDVAREYGLNLNTLVAELAEELPGAGVTGGGHEVAGSIKFVPGYRRQVLERLAEKLARLGA